MKHTAKEVRSMAALCYADGPKHMLLDYAELIEMLIAQPAAVPDALKALKELCASCPDSLQCVNFHHGKKEQHSNYEECGPAMRYARALKNGRAALAAAPQPAAPVPVRVHGWVWKEETDECTYNASYTPEQHIKAGELFALVDPADLPAYFTQWAGQDDKHPVVVNAPQPSQAEPVKRPQNCGTSFCSCIECPHPAPAPQQAEPAATVNSSGEVHLYYRLETGTDLYTQPARAPMPLTDERIEEIFGSVWTGAMVEADYLFARAVERAALAQQGKDAERLDWLQKHCTGASDSERYLPFCIYWGKGQNKTLREVIDAAIAAKGGA